MADILNHLTTLVAAFAGAWGAFLFESRRKGSEEKGRQRAVANRALYTVSNMWNVMYQYHGEIVAPYKGKCDSWLNMPATAPARYGLTSFDAEGLAFLLDCGEPMTYQKVLLEEQRFWGTIHLIEQRTAILLGRVHTALGAAGVRIGTPLSADDVETIIGIDVAHQLRVWTPAVMEQVEANVASLVEAHNTLRATMKKLYPKTKFVSVEFKALPDDTTSA